MCGRGFLMMKSVTTLHVRSVAGFGRTFRDPTGSGWLIWNCLGAILILTDMVLTPFAVAWGSSYEGARRPFGALSAGYWSLACISDFITGYYVDDKFVSDLVKIACRYCRTWFFVDAALLAVDWVSLFSDETSGNSHVLKLGRIMKLAKLIRLARLVRVKEAVTDFFDRHVSEGVHRALTASWWIACLLWLTHLMACAWFVVGGIDSQDTEREWVRSESHRGTPMKQYVKAFQWAINSIIGGSMDIVAQTTSERIFTIFCLGVGLFATSFCVSSLSAMMIEVQALSAGQSKKLRELKLFLRQSGLTVRFENALKGKIYSCLHEHRPLGEKDVELLSLVPDTMKMQLRLQIFEPCILTQPLFRFLLRLVPSWGADFARTLEEHFVQAPDILFSVGQRAGGALHLMHGRVEYTLDDDGDDMLSRSVNPGMWFSLAALWIEWRHVGKANVSMDCRMLHVSAESLSMAVKLDPQVVKVVENYARVWYCRTMAHAQDLPTDSEVVRMQWSDVVLDMDPQLVRIVSHMALEHHGRAWTPWQSTFDKLQEDTLNDKVVALTNEVGDLEIWSEVMVFHLLQAQNDGTESAPCMLPVATFWPPETSTPSPTSAPYMLVELGAADAEDKISVSVRYPGGRRLRSEPADQAVERLLTSKFDWLDIAAVKDSMKISERVETSRKHGLISACKMVSVDMQLEAPPTLPSRPVRFDVAAGMLASGSLVGRDRVPARNSLPSLRSSFIKQVYGGSGNETDGDPLAPVRTVSLPVYFASKQAKYYSFFTAAQMKFFQTQAGERCIRRALQNFDVNNFSEVGPVLSGDWEHI